MFLWSVTWLCTDCMAFIPEDGTFYHYRCDNLTSQRAVVTLSTALWRTDWRAGWRRDRLNQTSDGCANAATRMRE
jgi:hypothetical protein